MKNYIDFNFHMYTENVFGKGTENQAGDLVKKDGGSKALVVYGGGSVKKSGLYDRVIASLDRAGAAESKPIPRGLSRTRQLSLPKKKR